VPVSIVVLACLVELRHERHWAGPLRRLNGLLPLVRSGDAPIEELREVEGGFRQLVPQLQEIFHDLRRQKLAVAELNEEIRQRVAVRTGALERQMASLRQQASRDGLTGLYNRRMLEMIAPKLLESCRQQKLDLSVLMIDVDHFKMLNDTLGHAAGDELLRDVASIIRSSIRESDLALRYGGDEFVVLIPGASAEVAQATAKRLTSLVDGLTKPLKVEKPPRVSIGIAQLSALGDVTWEQLVDAADRALYDVKKKRRAEASLTAVYS
jgi:diguanylate cyclase (GGDEF)-like protein